MLIQILNNLFKRTEGPTFETVALKGPLSTYKYRVRIITLDRKITDPENFFKTSRKLMFSRFYIMDEELTKPHFAPSLKEALDRFMGKDFPEDGYNYNFWGTKTKLECPSCGGTIQIPFVIKTVESLTIYRESPNYQEIVGWRVSEVESDLMGKGVPKRFFTVEGGHSIISWESPKGNILCKRCAGL